MEPMLVRCLRTAGFLDDVASSPEVANVTGKYFYKRRPTKPSAAALDVRAALALWQRSAALAGMKE